MLISVVIPVFNAEKYLRQALRSALEQTLPPHEIIVVDDGSSDSSREIAASFGSAVTCLTQQHKGCSAARNLATKRSTGDWIAFLDADDYWLPDKLGRQAAVVQADPTIGLVYTGRTEISPDGTSRDVLARQPSWVKKRLAYANPMFPTTVIAKRTLLIENPWPESFQSSVDWWLFYRLSRVTNFAAIAEPTAVYRIHPKSLTSRDWESVLRNGEMVSQEIQKDFALPRKMLLGSRVKSRLLAHAAISAREQGSPEFLKYIVKSLISWPFPDIWPARYKIFLKMLTQKIQGAKT